MSYNMSSNWNQNNWDRRGRGGRGRGGRGFNRGNRGSWGRDNFRAPQPYGNQGGFWSENWNQDNFHGPGNRNINQQWKKKPSRDTPGKRLSEDEIGVVEYVNDHKGFSGIIKSRYSDFQVSEINEKGEVAKLTDMTPPTPIDDTVEEDEDLLFSKYNLEILPMATWDSINKLVVTQEDPTGKVEIDVTGMTKEQRTKIHDAVKKAFGESVVGSTVTINEKKLVCFEKYRKGVRIDNRVKWMWPGEYVYFIVHKENCDTMDAALRITERLRINMKVAMLGYAGTKDRRAKTSQWFSIRRVDPRRLATATSGLKNIRLGNYSFASTPLRLGLLQGNQFRIALRNVTAEDECVTEACELLRERGFLNYYGLQRFGTRADTPTYSIGLKLLQSKFQEALDSIMAEPTSDAGEARRGGLEMRVRRALARAPRDLQGALQKVPRNTRLLYLHSYQSLVWNRCVTERVRRRGLRPAAGDLAALQAVASEDLCDDDSEDEDASEKEDQDRSDKEVKSEADEQTEKEKEKERRRQNKDVPKPKLPVKVLTQEDVDSGRYTMSDIVLPLPGNNVDYPPNMKDYYEELLTKDGLELTMNHKMRAYCMSGAYRHMVCKPLAMRWELQRYSDPHADLIRSDWDDLSHGPAPRPATEGKFKALLLSLSLPASCYATMALRELLKADTAADAQAKLNHHTPPAPTDGSGGNGQKRKLDDKGDVDAKKAKTGDDGGQ